jgi:outer membrane protein assembly factor BamB
VKGDDLYVGFSDGTFASLRVSDGTIRWERTLNQARKFNDVNATAVLMDDGLLFVPSYDGALNVLKASGGETVWRFDAGGARKIQYDAERIYLSSSSGAVYAIEKNAPKQIWKFELDEGVPSDVVLADNGYLYVASSSHYLYVLNKQTGKALTRFYVGYGCGFSPTLGFDAARRRLYALSAAGNLYSFKVVAPEKVNTAAAPKSVLRTAP